MPDDPLMKLLLDADEVDRAVLAQALQGLLGIDNRTGRIVLKPGFNDLGSRKRVLAYLMGAKVASLLGKSDTEAVSPSVLAKETGMPKGTINPTLSRLHDDRRVSKTKAGAYYLEPHQIHTAVEEIRGQGD